MAPSARSLRILVVAGDPVERAAYQDALRAFGHQVGTAVSIHQAAELCRAAAVELVVTDADLPDGSGYQLAAAIGANCPVPMVVVAGEPDPAAVWTQAGSQVLMCVHKPVRPAALGAAVAAATRWSGRLRELEAEAAALKQAVEERKLFERAKGQVMKYCRLDEEAAYMRMRQFATERNERLVEVARMILAAGELFASVGANGTGRRTEPPGTRTTRLPADQSDSDLSTV
jgi:response regulator NasT